MCTEAWITPFVSGAGETLNLRLFSVAGGREDIADLDSALGFSEAAPFDQGGSRAFLVQA